MKILIAHNLYQQPGGEDRCVEAEVSLLRAHGHEVIQYTADNDAIDGMSRLTVAARTVWSRPAYRDLRELIREQRPAVAHFHNTFPLISPAAYHACRAEHVPVVQTLHNFRLLCPNALFFRDGKVCEDCLGRAVPWPGVVHGCYRGSRAASAAVAAMLTTHRALGTWQDKVDIYIALTEASRQKFLAGGLPANKLVVKPNFLDVDPGPGRGAGGYGIFVGRLSPEKGVGTLLQAWNLLDSLPPCGGGLGWGVSGVSKVNPHPGPLPQGGRGPELKIVGDGPLADKVSEAAAANPRIEWLKSQPPEAVYRQIADAAFLVLPSECYENFPRVAVEALAKGTPVIASRLGAMAEVIADGRTGLHFEAGNAADLAGTVRRFMADPTRMREAARDEFEDKYTAATNYDALMAIYERAGATDLVSACSRRL